jgi:hypothetical protein
MSAVISIDLGSLQVVFDGRWHRAVVDHFPESGEQIVTFCGVTEVVEFAVGRAAYVNTCWGCDLAYRRKTGISYLPDHPGLQATAEVVPTQNRIRPRPRPH